MEWMDRREGIKKVIKQDSSYSVPILFLPKQAFFNIYEGMQILQLECNPEERERDINKQVVDPTMQRVEEEEEEDSWDCVTFLQLINFVQGKRRSCIRAT